MVKEIRIHYEGDLKLKEGFRIFFDKLAFAAYSRQCRVRFIAGRGRYDAIHDFQDALKSHSSSWNVLLIDSEGPDDGKLFVQLGLPARQRDSVFWMVQLMESWFLADVPALRLFYGDGFRVGQAPAKGDIERAPKSDVLKSLKKATKATQKGAYDKAEQAPRLLGLIDSDLVRKASPSCQRMSTAFRAHLENA